MKRGKIPKLWHALKGVPESEQDEAHGVGNRLQESFSHWQAMSVGIPIPGAWGGSIVFYLSTNILVKSKKVIAPCK